MDWSLMECCGSSTPSWQQPSSRLFYSFHTATHHTVGGRNTPQNRAWVLVHWRSFPVTEWRAESSVYLCDAYSGYPQVHGPSIVAAQVLDVLRLFLDLRMLKRQTQHIRITQHTQPTFFSVAHIKSEISCFWNTLRWTLRCHMRLWPYCAMSKNNNQNWSSITRNAVVLLFQALLYGVIGVS